MLVLKFTCDDAHVLNTDIIAEKFSEAIGVDSKHIAIKKSENAVKLYLGPSNSNNISLNIEVTDEDF